MEREAEYEYETEVPGSGTVTFRCYIERHSGSRDEVVVHVYHNVGDDVSEREHDLYRFFIVDEDAQECKYRTTRNKAEPSNLALIGLQEYGWDCTNFDQTSAAEAQAESADAFADMADTMSRIAATLDNPPNEELLRETWARLTILSATYDYEHDEDDLITALSGETTVTVPEYLSPEEQRAYSNAAVERFKQLVADHADADDFVVDDQRSMK